MLDNWVKAYSFGNSSLVVNSVVLLMGKGSWLYCNATRFWFLRNLETRRRIDVSRRETLRETDPALRQCNKLAIPSNAYQNRIKILMFMFKLNWQLFTLGIYLYRYEHRHVHTRERSRVHYVNTGWFTCMFIT